MTIVWTEGRRRAVTKCRPWIEKAMDTVTLDKNFKRFAFHVADFIDDPGENPIPEIYGTYFVLRDNLLKLLDQYSQTLSGMTREQRDLLQVIQELEESIDALEVVTVVEPSSQ